MSVPEGEALGVTEEQRFDIEKVGADMYQWYRDLWTSIDYEEFVRQYQERWR